MTRVEPAVSWVHPEMQTRGDFGSKLRILPNGSSSFTGTSSKVGTMTLPDGNVVVYLMRETFPLYWKSVGTSDDLADVRVNGDIAEIEAELRRHGWDGRSEMLHSSVPCHDGTFAAVFTVLIDAPPNAEDTLFEKSLRERIGFVASRKRALIASTRSLPWLRELQVG